MPQIKGECGGNPACIVEQIVAVPVPHRSWSDAVLLPGPTVYGEIMKVCTWIAVYIFR